MLQEDGKLASRTARILAAIAILGGLTLLGLMPSGFLIFHTLVEFLSVSVSLAVFMIAWNMRRQMPNGFLLFIGLVAAGAGIIDLLHTMSFKGMGPFADADANMPTQFWIAGRYLYAAGLLLAPLWLTRPLPHRRAAAVLAAVTTALVLSVLRPWSWIPAFPTCFDGQLTPFKIVSEYVICLLLVAALGLLWKRRALLDRGVLIYMAAAIIVTIASEISFTNYISVFGLFNVIGHVAKAAAVYLLYKALVEGCLRRPYDVLFRDLTASEQRFRGTFDNAAVGIAHVGLDGRFLRVNDRMCDITGFDREELREKTFADITPQPHRQVDLEQAARLNAGEIDRYSMEKTYLRKDNREIWVNLTCSLQHDRQGRPTYFIAVVEDIEPRKTAEKALRRSLERFALLSRLAGDLLQAPQPQTVLQALCHEVMNHLDCDVFFNYLFNDDTGLLHLNAFAGIESDEARRIEQLHLGQAVCGSAAQDGRRVVCERIDASPDERTALVHAYGVRAYACHPLIGHGGRTIGTLSFGTRRRDAFSEDDLSLMRAVADHVAVAMERIHAMRELERAKEQLEQRVRQRTLELSRTVETLREEVVRRLNAEQSLRKRSSQLQGLAMELTLAEQRERRRLAELLHDELQQLLVGCKFALAELEDSDDPRIRNCCDRVTELLDASIDCSRTLTSELSPSVLHHGDLGTALRWLADWMAARHELHVDIEGANGDDGGDAGISPEMKLLLFQSVRELLFNVVKHAGVAKAQVSLERVDGRIRLTVRDEGRGFDPDALEPGDGFGLFSIHERLEVLGGRVTIDSSPGHGSVFVMEAPLDRSGQLAD